MFTPNYRRALNRIKSLSPLLSLYLPPSATADAVRVFIARHYICNKIISRSSTYTTHGRNRENTRLKWASFVELIACIHIILCTCCAFHAQRRKFGFALSLYSIVRCEATWICAIAWTIICAIYVMNTVRAKMVKYEFISILVYMTLRAHRLKLEVIEPNNRRFKLKVKASRLDDGYFVSGKRYLAGWLKSQNRTKSHKQSAKTAEQKNKFLEWRILVLLQLSVGFLSTLHFAISNASINLTFRINGSESPSGSVLKGRNTRDNLLLIYWY